MRDGRRAITTAFAGKKKKKTRIIRECYVKFHANNLDNLEEMYKFLEWHKRPNQFKKKQKI